MRFWSGTQFNVKKNCIVVYSRESTFYRTAVCKMGKKGERILSFSVMSCPPPLPSSNNTKHACEVEQSKICREEKELTLAKDNTNAYPPRFSRERIELNVRGEGMQ